MYLLVFQVRAEYDKPYVFTVLQYCKDDVLARVSPFKKASSRVARARRGRQEKGIVFYVPLVKGSTARDPTVARHRLGSRVAEH